MSGVEQRRGRVHHGREPYLWPARDPAQLGIDPTRVEAVASFARAHEAESLLVLREGELILERYWGRQGGDLQQTYSGTKSLFSLLVLRLIANGALAGLDQPIRDLIPEREDPQGQLTFRSIMAMQSGLENSPQIESLGETGLTQLEIGLQTPIVAPPFTTYYYNNAGYRLLFTALERATGMDLEALTETQLFEPLGFGSAHWQRLYWFDGNIERFQGYQSICMAPRDFAKSAQVIVDDGLWHGERFVDEGLCRELVKAPSPGDNPSFGLFHHLNAGSWFRAYVEPKRLERKLAPGCPDDLFLQYGAGGQMVAGSKSLRLVVARTGRDDGSSIYPRENHFIHLLAMISSLVSSAEGTAFAAGAE